jgi:hypothetical protein
MRNTLSTTARLSLIALIHAVTLAAILSIPRHGPKPEPKPAVKPDTFPELVNFAFGNNP